MMHSFLWRPESIILHPTILWFMLKAAMLICPDSVLAMSLSLGILFFWFFIRLVFWGFFNVFLFCGGKTWDQKSGGVSDFIGQSRPNYIEQENSSSFLLWKPVSGWSREIWSRTLCELFHILLFRSRYVWLHSQC